MSEYKTIKLEGEGSDTPCDLQDVNQKASELPEGDYVLVPVDDLARMREALNFLLCRAHMYIGEEERWKEMQALAERAK